MNLKYVNYRFENLIYRLLKIISLIRWTMVVVKSTITVVKFTTPIVWSLSYSRLESLSICHNPYELTITVVIFTMVVVDNYSLRPWYIVIWTQPSSWNWPWPSIADHNPYQVKIALDLHEIGHFPTFPLDWVVVLLQCKN